MEILSVLTASNRPQLQKLEKALGYRFKDINLLQLALIHRSFAFENDGRPGTDNERLEYLGDAVLDLTVGHLLFGRYLTMREGELTKLRAMLVNEGYLAGMAEKIGLGQYLCLGKGEDASAGRSKPSILSCAYEAMVGAIFHDGGYSAVAEFVRLNFGPGLDGQKAKLHMADAKSALQELTQEKYNEAPVYVVEKAAGPDHRKIFTVSVRFRGEVLAHGEASSKKEAEQQAAAAALRKFAESAVPPQV